MSRHQFVRYANVWAHSEHNCRQPECRRSTDSTTARAGPPREKEELAGNTFHGSYTVQVTPFTAGGADICLESQRRFLDWQVECEVPGIIILGSTGEFLTITDDERKRFVETTVTPRRRPHARAGRHHERAHTDGRALQPRGRADGSGRPDGHSALLLHADRRRDLRLLRGDLAAPYRSRSCSTTTRSPRTSTCRRAWSRGSRRRSTTSATSRKRAWTSVGSTT